MFLTTNNTQVPEEFLQAILFLFKKYWPQFLNGMSFTLLISLTGTLIGLVLAMVIVPLKIQKVSSRDHILIAILKRFFVFLTTFYVEVLRGTPMIVQAVIIYYGLVGAGVPIDIIVCGILIVSVNTSAYITEVLRGSINAINKGQMEAARSIGMTRWQAMIHVIIPQAVKNSIPAIGNEFVINIKDTAVLNVIAVTELFYVTRQVNGEYYRMVEGFTITAVLYLFMTFTTTRILYLVSYITNNKEKISYPTSQSFVKRVFRNEKNNRYKKS